ncbi:MAG: tetratricopeptide repeat protein [Proteobacteria bacterium]|nr:tetratricopeptide repeat protein [Pseudomonadota bacterium]NIS67633.1 tetratricopeptide repeat protein [Pseudomonadota bacterium]
MKKSRNLKWVLLGLSAACIVALALWMKFANRPPDKTEVRESELEDMELPFERKNTEAMGLGQLKVYIRECERARDFSECERAYQQAIQLTLGKESMFRDFIDFQFGLAELYLNSLWEYGQFGKQEEIPPGLNRAMDIYDEIIASYPNSELAAEAQFKKGEVFHNEFSGYWNRLHRDDAVREFQKVVQNYPHTDQARRAKERLATLQKEE